MSVNIICNAEYNEINSCQIDVSIVVPVYNVEKYLQRCMCSILKHKELEIEVICVEDCSQDNSLDMLNQIAAADDRIRIERNDRNQGLAFSRNRALDLVRGEYVVFVDSDDYLPDDAITVMHHEAVKRNLDVLYGDIELVNDSGESESYEQKRIRKHEYTDGKGMRLFQEMTKYQELFGSVWGVIYKTSFLRKQNLQFQSGILHEDIPFTFKAALSCERAGCVSYVCYYYTQRSGSIMSGENIEKRMEGMILGYFEMLRFWNTYSDLSYELNYGIVEFLKKYREWIRDMYVKIGKENFKRPMLKYLGETGAFERYTCGIHIADEDIKKIKNIRRTFIYGAGGVALKTLDYLNERNIHVDAFVVSSQENNPSQINGIAVIPVEKLNKMKQEIIVIIGVSNKYQHEVVRHLQQKKIETMVIPDVGHVWQMEETDGLVR